MTASSTCRRPPPAASSSPPQPTGWPPWETLPELVGGLRGSAPGASGGFGGGPPRRGGARLPGGGRGARRGGGRGRLRCLRRGRRVGRLLVAVHVGRFIEPLDVLAIRRRPHVI